MTAAQVAAALEGAVQVLAEQGWRQGPRTIIVGLDGIGPVDVGAAVILAAESRTTDQAEFWVTFTDALGVLAEWIGDTDTGPVSWRDPESLAVDVDAWADAPGRTLREVVHALYGAARLAHPTRDREAA